MGHGLVWRKSSIVMVLEREERYEKASAGVLEMIAVAWEGWTVEMRKLRTLADMISSAGQGVLSANK